MLSASFRHRNGKSFLPLIGIAKKRPTASAVGLLKIE
jgi:hypothetical protein